MVVSARRGDQQNWWLLWTWLGGLVFGLLLYAMLAGPLAGTMPTSWQWPERKAADALDMPMWDAGQHLLDVANLEAWRAIVAGDAIVRDNHDAIQVCRKTATKAVRCMIELKAARE